MRKLLLQLFLQLFLQILLCHTHHCEVVVVGVQTRLKGVWQIFKSTLKV